MKRTALMLLAIGLIAAPAAGLAKPKPAAVDGKAAFAHRCGVCHRDMGMGTLAVSRRMGFGMGPDMVKAWLENRGDLTADYVVAVIRNGQNSMPPLSRVEVSDADAAAIGRYLAKKK